MSSWTRGPAVLDRSDLISIRPGLLQSCSVALTNKLLHWQICPGTWEWSHWPVASRGDTILLNKQMANKFFFLFGLKFHKCSQVNILHLSLELHWVWGRVISRFSSKENNRKDCISFISVQIYILSFWSLRYSYINV